MTYADDTSSPEKPALSGLDKATQEQYITDIINEYLHPEDGALS
jgi:hypothetical protein